MNNWILQDKFKLPEQDQLNHLINDISKATSLKNFEFKKYINEILTIVFYFANDPWTTQKTILSKLNITKKELISINKFIRENKLLQDLITNKGSELLPDIAKVISEIIESLEDDSATSGLGDA